MLKIAKRKLEQYYNYILYVQRLSRDMENIKIINLNFWI